MLVSKLAKWQQLHIVLHNSVQGKLDDGLIFCGSNVHRAKEIVSVHDLIHELVD